MTIHRLVAADTVEDVIAERLQRKRAIADTAVVGVAGKDEAFVLTLAVGITVIYGGFLLASSASVPALDAARCR